MDLLNRLIVGFELLDVMALEVYHSLLWKEDKNRIRLIRSIIRSMINPHIVVCVDPNGRVKKANSGGHQTMFIKKRPNQKLASGNAIV